MKVLLSLARLLSDHRRSCSFFLLSLDRNFLGVLLFASIVVRAQEVQGGPPEYALATASKSVIEIPSSYKTSPPWANVSAGHTFTAEFGGRTIQYTRVTDAKTYQSCNPSVAAGRGFAVTSGSGDVAVFNKDDTMFTITDSGSNHCFFTFDPDPASPRFMQTAYLYSSPGKIPVEGAWSQTNSRYWYAWNGPLYRYDFTGCAPGSCKPIITKVYDYVSNCDVKSPYFISAAGVGNNDTIFGVHYSAGVQDSGKAALAYDFSTNTCYRYDTREMLVKRHTGAAGSTGNPSYSGTVNCDGTRTISWMSGNIFDTTPHTWQGSVLTVGSRSYGVQTVNSSRTLTARTECKTVKGAKYSIVPGLLVTDGDMAQDSYSIHNVKIDPSGHWMVVVAARCTNRCPDATAVYLWQIGTNKVVPCTANCTGHWTTSASNFLNVPDGKLHYRAFASAKTEDMAYTSTVPPVITGFDVHPTNKNDAFGINSRVVLSSTYAPEGPYWTITHPLSNEVIAWPQVAESSILRFGHTYNSALSSEGFAARFAIGAASSTGNFYLFTTDGEGTLSEGSEVWLMRLQ